MNYPKRGCMSDDGKYYTHTDGSVHKFSTPFVSCAECSINAPGVCGLVSCPGGKFELVKVAYVPSDEEREACETMILGIEECGYRNRIFRLEIEPEFHGKGCSVCPMLTAKTCPLRAYLDKHKQPDAWEAKP